MDGVWTNPATLERRRQMTQDKVRARPAPPTYSPEGFSSEYGPDTRSRSGAWASKTRIGPMKTGLLLTAAVAAMLIRGNVAQAEPWNFVTLQDTTAGAITTVATGINNAGQIVGYYVDPGLVTHGFGYSGGSYTTIDVPSSAATTASGIS